MKLNWIVLAIIALISFSIMVTLIGFLSKRAIPLSFILFGIFFIGAISYGFQTLVTTHFKFEISFTTLLFILVMGILSFIGNWAQFQATTLAPNPGLAIAIVGLQSGAIAVLAFILFRDKMTNLQILGLGIGLLGIIIMSVGGKK